MLGEREIRAVLTCLEGDRNRPHPFPLPPRTGEGGGAVRPHGLLRMWFRVLAGSAPLWFAGCMTHSLWTGELVDRFSEPSVPNNLALYAAPERHDVLAQYDELSPGHRRSGRRAYFVRENQDKIGAVKRPRFEALESTNGLAPIPLYADPAAGTDLTGAGDIYALTTTNGSGFTIISTNADYSGSFELPTYPTAFGTGKLVALTPVTVALDVSVVGGVIGYFILYAWAQSGGNFYWRP